MMKESHDNDCKLVFVDHDWVCDPSDISDTIYVPPADWIINEDGVREMYIPPAGWVPDCVDSDEDHSDEALKDKALKDDLLDVHDPSTTSVDYTAIADHTAIADSGASTPSALQLLPAHVDLRPEGHRDYIYNQYQYASCVANAVSSAFLFALNKSNGYNNFLPSRLFIWYNGRKRFTPSRIHLNKGCYMGDTIQSVIDEGVCSEEAWAYRQVGAFNEATSEFAQGSRGRRTPSPAIYLAALQHKIVVQRPIKLERGVGLTAEQEMANLNLLRGCLAQGYPFAFGFKLFEETLQKNKVLEMPEGTEEGGRLSGHAVLAIGYDNTREHFLIQNSWGPDWHQAGCSDGCFFMPYRYILERGIADSFWSIHQVSN